MLSLPVSTEVFLAEYWQRKPLLIPGGLTAFSPPVSAEELAGLAMEPEAESRIVVNRNSQWQLHHGPFSARDFNRDSPWTLLVQRVDHWVPEVADIRREVPFIPGWRIDDVMVSYANDGGSVGPHFDNYDVFLLQGDGVRRWKIGQYCDEAEPLLDHPDLLLLAEFRQEDEFVLNCGDILYVPPRVAHWGIAEGDCTTYSIGFRAPRLADLLSRRTDAALESLGNATLFKDPVPRPSARPGELSRSDIEAATTQLINALAQQQSPQWMGELITEGIDTEHGPDGAMSDEEAASLLGNGITSLTLQPEARVCWTEHEGSLWVFAGGDSLSVSKTHLPLLMELCDTWTLSPPQVEEMQSLEAGPNLLAFLLTRGALDVEA